MKSITNRMFTAMSFIIVAFFLSSCKKEQANQSTDLQLHSKLKSVDMQSLIQSRLAQTARVAQADYLYLLGEEPFTEGPDKALAPDGEVISLMGSGTLSIHEKSVTGSGEFTHSAANGTVLASGTWTALELLSFHSYGNSAPEVPAEFEGGRALVRVHLSPKGGGAGLDTVFQIDCLLGNPPSGSYEGVRVAVQGAQNFNEAIHGQTLFIRR